MGNTVSRYTRSPSAAVFVLMLLIMLSGIRVPMVTTKSSGLAAAFALVAGVVTAGAGAGVAPGAGVEIDSEAGGSGAGGCWAVRAATAASVMKAKRTYIWHFLFFSLNAGGRQR